MGSPLSGYGHPAYALAAAGKGVALQLPRSRGSVIVRDIGMSGRRDAIGPYPIFSCDDWAGLHKDLSDLSSDLVTVGMVTDPFGAWSNEVLQRCFPDVLVRFKEHFVVQLSADPLSHVHAHHRRNIALGRRNVEVAVVDDVPAFTEEWQALYGHLVQRHRIRGPANFSPGSLAAQLLVPGMVALRARRDGETVGASLWYEQGDIAYYHLAAYVPLAYKLRASYALFATAFERFAERGLAWASLGAGAGTAGDPDDGLSRFKRGWSTDTRTAWFGGRVLQPDIYEHLTEGSRGPWFPAYREHETG